MNSPSKPIPVAVLGATGTVGQRLVERIIEHPWFELIEVAASERSEGRTLADAADWGGAAVPEVAAGLTLGSLDGPFSAALVLSALPGSAARDVEPRLAAAGHMVVSNASALRAEPTVPLVIPEVNPDHLALVESGAGGVITNPNCAVVPMAMALAPLHEAFGVERVVATTFQAVSGAGRPGPGTLTLLDNVLPHIAGEEEKIEREPQKILGSVQGDTIRSADFIVSATSTRVPVLHGHLVDLSVALKGAPSVGAIRDALVAYEGRVAHLGLPSLPPRPLTLHEAADRPQPRLDRDQDGGMAVGVGRVRACPAADVRFTVLAHNLERGAAGAAIANAELVVARGLVGAREHARSAEAM